ncbi:hypothetical protein [Egbenema bharatensis]|uniref:hypothetical protein n=1 Tax=Egbenema bharatensis TaxID=3463334 RepID=UPI003A858B12
MIRLFWVARDSSAGDRDNEAKSGVTKSGQVQYIRQNPVTAGLSCTPESYPFLWQTSKLS